jgi:hypothetical protein
MEKERGPESGEVRIIDGVLRKKVFSGYTLREYYSHDGPGWDYRWEVLKKYGLTDAARLPDEPYYEWVPVEDSGSN